jgi:hypothetical protein
MRAVLLLLLLALAQPASAADPSPAPPARRTVNPLPGARPTPLAAQRTTSSSKQFLVFCADSSARSQVASYAEELKTSLLQIFGEPDQWKHNILVTLENASAAADQPPAQLALFQNENGFKIQIDIRIGSDPSKANLQRLLVRALLLEYSYRNQPQLLRAGQAFAEAPWWLIEGVMQIFLRRDSGLDADLFKRIVDVNRLPPIGKFLAGHPSDFDGSAVETMDQACAMCLVQLLIDQAGGRASLASFVRNWPRGNGDSVASLMKEFSGLAQNEQSLQKWWTLNLARFSAADRYKGLNSAETEKELEAILRLEIALPESTTPKPYSLADYPDFLKAPTSMEALRVCHDSLLALTMKAPPLYRPLVAEYAEIVQFLQRGKTRGLKSRITKVDQVRADLNKRMIAITDYLNWLEATQMTTRSGKFEGYLKAANEVAERPSRNDPLSTFLDEAEARAK